MDAAALSRADDRLRYIAEALDRPRQGEERPATAPPAALSAYRTYQALLPRLPWEPTCHHSTMATLYQDAYECESCGEWSKFGFLYCCTVDRDPLILGAKNAGYRVTFDELGRFFADQMTLGKFGPDARSQQYSLLKEMSVEQMRSYTPQQLTLLLSQRENVHKVIADERERAKQSWYPEGLKFPYDSRPWMPDHRYECQYRVCHWCHPSGRDKSWLSLNAVLNGDILPTAAMGFSYSYFRVRPCLDADVLKNIGYRPVPLPRGHPARARTCPESDMSASMTPDTEMVAYASPSSALTPASGLSLAGTATPEPLPETDGKDSASGLEVSSSAVPCSTPLPVADSDGKLFSAEAGPATKIAQDEQTLFATEVLNTVDGVALTEEAVETGTADMVAPAMPAALGMSA
ncbi:hypothetical protein VTK56DRAFT_8510 [Thermocarpiscus australiensis]